MKLAVALSKFIILEETYEFLVKEVKKINKMENKTHYRKVYKSDHLGVADLEELLEDGKSLIFTIKEVKQELNVTVAGKKGDFNIAYFNEKIKPLVLNATNAKIVSKFNNNSSFVEDWSDTIIELYIDPNVKMKGELVGGIRIKPIKPTPKEKPIFNESHFAQAFDRNITIERIKQTRQVTKEVEQKYLDYCNERNNTKN